MRLSPITLGPDPTRLTRVETSSSLPTPPPTPPARSWDFWLGLSALPLASRPLPQPGRREPC